MVETQSPFKTAASLLSRRSDAVLSSPSRACTPYVQVGENTHTNVCRCACLRGGVETLSGCLKHTQLDPRSELGRRAENSCLAGAGADNMLPHSWGRGYMMIMPTSVWAVTAQRTKALATLADPCTAAKKSCFGISKPTWHRSLGTPSHPTPTSRF